MRKAVYILLLLLVVKVSARAQPIVEAIEKDMKPIRQGIFIYSFEVSNFQYSHFLDEIAQTENQKYEKAKWDTTRWRSTLRHYKPFEQYYHSHEEYQDFPAVNMSQKGAELFCDWLTAQYNTWADRNFNTVKFRLPTEEEWQLALASGDLSQRDSLLACRKVEFVDKEGYWTVNFRHLSQSQLKMDRFTDSLTYVLETDSSGFDGNSLMSSVKGFLPNSLGCFNLQGNVAEWIDEEGITKGGSYATTGWYLLPESQLQLNPDFGYPDVGFRFIMEVIEP